MGVRSFLAAVIVILATGIRTRADVVYATSFQGGNVYKIAADGAATPFATGFSGPTGLALDGAGNLFVADGPAGTVSEVTPAGAVSTIASGLNSPYGLAFDHSGTLYVSGMGTISKISASHTVTPFVSGLGGSGSIAFDSAGNLFVVSNSGNDIRKIAPDGTVSNFANLVGPIGLAFDGGGNLYSAKFIGTQPPQEQIVKFTPAGQSSAFATPPQPEGTVWGMEFGSAGTLYIATAHHIDAVAPDGTITNFASIDAPNLIAVQVPEPSLTLLAPILGLLAHRRRAFRVG